MFLAYLIIGEILPRIIISIKLEIKGCGYEVV
jgi:hypothetical protein